MVVDRAHAQPRSRKSWRAWLHRHHRKSTGVWLVYAKKHTGIPSLTWQEAVEEALCYGWIDGVRHPVDETYFKQLFTPRKPKSTWSAINRKTIDRLVEAGLMSAAGFAAVALAKANGAWDSLTSVETGMVPPDLQRALARNAKAKRNWASFTPGARKIALYYVNAAKRDETRVRRIARIIDLVERNITPNQANRAASRKRGS